MDDTWKKDPRLASMSQEKLELLTNFSERLKQTDKSSLMDAFLSINREAQQKGLSFNDRETALLVNILGAHMPPSEKKKINLLKMLSKKLASPH